jgi:hypothetical protein
MVIYLEDYLRRVHVARADRAARRARLLCANSRTVLHTLASDEDTVIDLDRLDHPNALLDDQAFMHRLYAESSLA